MRYTTLIDITEIPAVYGNHHARLLYMHMALKAGYHDTDRDILAISIRRLADDAGMTVSATRHALQQLQKAGLISKQGQAWRVLKWIVVPPPTPRTQKAAQQAKAASVGSIAERMDREVEQYKKRVLEAVRSCTKEQLEQWAAELDEGRSLKHCGVQINANQDNVRWLRDIIKSM